MKARGPHRIYVQNPLAFSFTFGQTAFSPFRHSMLLTLYVLLPLPGK